MKRRDRVSVICKEIISEFPDIDSLKLRQAVDRGVRESGRIAFEEAQERKRKWKECGRYIYATKRRKNLCEKER